MENLNLPRPPTPEEMLRVLSEAHPDLPLEKLEKIRKSMMGQMKESLKAFEEGDFISLGIVQRGEFREPGEESIGEKLNPRQFEELERKVEDSDDEMEERRILYLGRPPATPLRAANIGNDSLERRLSFIFNEESGLAPVERKEVVGVDAILNEVDNYVNFLRNYLKLKESNVRTSPGLILHGAPGLGKTYIARYIATVSRARAIQVNHFPRKDAKWKAQDIIALFDLAKKYVEEKKEPLILYWDEFESVGKERSMLSADEVETVSAFTSQIEGFSGKIKDVIIMGSTNYFEALDRALIRPGRMGHHVLFSPPSYNGKIKILKYYVEKKPHEEGIDFESIGYFFPPSASPALIETRVEDAWLRACLGNLEYPEKARITKENLSERLVKSLLGTPLEISLSDDDLFRVSVHETGHAYLARALGEPVQLVCILPHGYSGGKTISIHPEDHPLHLRHLKNNLIFGYGGLLASEMFGFREYGGHQNDIEQITEIARNLVLEHGEGRSFPNVCPKELYLGNDRAKVFSNEFTKRCEDDIFQLTTDAYTRAKSMLEEFGKERIAYTAKQIIKHRIVFQKDLDGIIEEAKLL